MSRVEVVHPLDGNLVVRHDLHEIDRADRGPGGRMNRLNRLARYGMAGGLLFMVWGETAHPGITGLHGKQLATSVALAVAALAWIGWAIAGPLGDSRKITVTVWSTGVAGSVLLVIHPATAICWFTFWSCVSAGAQLPRWPGRVLASVCVGILLAGYLAHQGDSLATFAAVGFVAYVVGWNRAEASRVAAMAERARLARELHDILGHSLSALSVRIESAAAALEAAGDQQAALEQLELAAALTRSGQEEAVAAVRTLRDGTLGVAELLDALVASAPLDITMETTGTHRDLSAATGMTLYRVIQEAITNAVKHAPGAPVAVTLDYSPTAVTATVVNKQVEGADAVHGGQGLRGIKERVTAVGGTCEVGETADGWRVAVSVPA